MSNIMQRAKKEFKGISTMKLKVARKYMTPLGTKMVSAEIKRRKA